MDTIMITDYPIILDTECECEHPSVELKGYCADCGEFVQRKYQE